LPTSFIDRVARDELDMADAGCTIVITLTPREIRSGNGRGPTRVQATDAAGNYVSLLYFGGHPGWAKKLGTPRAGGRHPSMSSAA
jgi:ATP-dependent DNA helicase RecG